MSRKFGEDSWCMNETEETIDLNQWIEYSLQTGYFDEQW